MLTADHALPPKKTPVPTLTAASVFARAGGTIEEEVSDCLQKSRQSPKTEGKDFRGAEIRILSEYKQLQRGGREC
jgi:hypothetical protein